MECSGVAALHMGLPVFQNAHNFSTNNHQFRCCQNYGARPSSEAGFESRIVKVFLSRAAAGLRDQKTGAATIPYKQDCTMRAV